MNVVIIQGLSSERLMTGGYGGTLLLTTLDLGRSVGTGEGAKAKGSTDTTAKSGAG